MLGTTGLTWRRLRVHVEQSAADPASALWRDLGGEMADWPLSTQLLAAVANNTADMLWLKTEDATRKIPQQRPIPIRPPPLRQSAPT